MSEKTQIVITASDQTRTAIASAQRGLESLSASAGKLRNAFSFLGSAGGLAGLLGGAGLVATVNDAVNNLDRLDEAAERVGVSVEELSALNFAGKMSGLEFEDMTAALTKLSVKMQEAASGSKEASALFSDLGVKVTDSSGKLKTADQVFTEIAERFAKLEDGAGKTALAVDVFGKSGVKLVPLLNQGAGGLQRMREEAQSLGAIIDGKLAKQGAEFNDNLDRLKTLSAAAGISVASNLIPQLNKAAESFLIAQKYSDGFFDSLRLKMPGLQDVNPAAEFAKVQNELEQIDFRLSNGRSKNKEEDQRRLNELERRAAYYRELVALRERAEKPAADGGTEPVKRTPTAAGTSGDGGKKTADEAARLIQQLNEQIALKSADVATTDKMSAAEQQRVRVLYQLDAGILKTSTAQREKITATLDELVVLERTLQAQKEYSDALQKQEQANVASYQSLLEKIAAAEREADLYGLSAAQISVVEQARLADAIAIARQSGATDDQIAFLEEELRLRGQLSDALIAVDVKKTSLDLKEQTSIAKDLGMTFSSAFEDAVAGGKKFRDILEGIAQDIARILLRKNITEPFAAAIGSIDFASIFGFANGGIMTSAGPLPLRQYASGGVASSPQLALFGEGSRPEAFVPLPDGRRIPVAMEGGGSNVVINVNNTASDTKASASTREDSSGTTIIDIVVERVESSMARRISQGGGVAPLLERRYGLNPAAGAVR